ncbi:RNA 2',3'-cyclic phosphodiesterase [Myceligenerans crystallogenes]|uniref:RNA 2',3'-cyclic phosphodiesterase n=1 Tax=Myceligenerans crystallogenes TaxID=316335 RepID=A0ABN2NKQ5_9MICO
MRLFAAIFPPDEVLDHLDLAIHGVRSNGVSPRWMPRETQHVTLAFYADVPEGTVDELSEGLAVVAGKHGPLDLRLRGAGSFGSRVLWIGVDGELSPLRNLAADCLDASVREVPDDVKPHRPHLTIARARAGQVRPPRGRDRWGKARGGRSGADFSDARSQLDPVAHALSVYAGPAWTAESFALVESLPGEGPQGGSLYRIREHFELRG